MSAPRTVDSKTRLVNAALEMFLEQGGDDLKVAEVAKRAGVSVGTFYIYFHNLRALLTEAVSSRSEQILENVFGTYVRTARIGQPNGPPVLARLLTSEAGELEPLLLYAMQASTTDPGLRARLAHLFCHLRSSIVAKVREAVDHGILRADTDPEPVGTILFMTMIGSIVTRAVMDERFDPLALTEALQRFSEVVQA